MCNARSETNGRFSFSSVEQSTTQISPRRHKGHEENNAVGLQFFSALFGNERALFFCVIQQLFPFFTQRNTARIIRPFRGGIAQLGERLHGMQEVSGSIPLTSTTKQSCRSKVVEVPIV